jgi:hypothetical protein
MTKPLKDIGDQFYRESTDNGNRRHEYTIMLTLEERRELVRRVWETALDGVHTDGFCDWDTTETVDEFIEREGL